MAFSSTKNTTRFVGGSDNAPGLVTQLAAQLVTHLAARSDAAPTTVTPAENRRDLAGTGGDRPMTKPETELTIREFRSGDESAFRRLNEEWIVRHFALEPKDESALADPQRSILDAGGRIFLAARHGEAVGCCALLAMGPGEFELAKMAVTESCQGAGIGRRLLDYAIAAARASGATRLYLETNRKLGAAIRLYESAGFRHIPPERVVASPYTRSNVSIELYL